MTKTDARDVLVGTATSAGDARSGQYHSARAPGALGALDHAAAERPAAPVAGYPPVRRARTAFAGLLLVMLVASLDATIVSTALPTIVEEFGRIDGLAWVVTGYVLAQTVVTPVYGKLGDLYGRKRVLQAALVFFLAGSALCGLSRTLMQLVLFRIVQGIGGGGLIVSVQASVSDLFAPRDRGRYQGVTGAVFGASSIAGPLLGGLMIAKLSWRWIFFVNLPIGVVALSLLGAALPASSPRRQHVIDYAGILLLAVTLGAVTLAAGRGAASGAHGPLLTLGLLATAALAVAAFVRVERSAAEPIVPLRLFECRTFTIAANVGLVVAFAVSGSVAYIPALMQYGAGLSAAASGLQLAPMTFGMLAMSIVSGQVISRTGRYRHFPIIGTALLTVGLAMLSALSARAHPLWSLACMFVLGLGVGMVVQVLVVAVQNAVAHQDVGVATSGITMFRMIGGSLGTAGLGAVFAARLRANLSLLLPAGGDASAPPLTRDALAALPPTARSLHQAAFLASFRTVFLVAAGVCAFGFALSWRLPAHSTTADEPSVA